MDDDTRCCTECGCTDFKQRRVALIEYTVRFDRGYEQDAGEEIIDGGDRDGEFRCDDCGQSYISEDEMTTVEDFHAEDDNDEGAIR